MEKYIAFGLYQKNDQGGHQLVIDGGIHGEAVYLAAQVDALVAAVPAYLLDPLDSHYCEPLAKTLRDLMVK